jgi:8-oxo-dGTP pyrophosphatase MutT (NUDIX family)
MTEKVIKPGSRGSMRPEESPEAAALREAREETGFTQFKIVRKSPEGIRGRCGRP